MARMAEMIPEPVHQVEEDKDNSWENEDPNLLNNYELLYKECEKLPLPVEVEGDDEAFYEGMCIVRDLILDNNVVLEAISKKDEIVGNKEEAFKVMENLKAVFHSGSLKCLNKIVEHQNMPSWDKFTRENVFKQNNTERIQRWKMSLNEFMESYLKIREFIPKENLEGSQLARSYENIKEQAKQFPLLVEELENLLKILESFAD